LLTLLLHAWVRVTIKLSVLYYAVLIRSRKNPELEQSDVAGMEGGSISRNFPFMRTALAITDPTKFDLITTRNSLTHKNTRVISGFRRGVNEICARLGLYAA
jgi:hypothetical protein